MEHTIAVVSLNHLQDMLTYAKRCGINSRAVQRRIREKQVAYAVVDGSKLIDTLASPPVKKLKRGYKNTTPVDSKGVPLHDLVSISKLASEKRITTSRFYKAILQGKLRAVYIAAQYYVHKSDAAFTEVLKNG